MSSICSIHYQADDVIFSEGEQGDCAYIIESGKVSILKNTDDGETCLATLQRGDLFGEMSMLDHADRTATAVADEDCTVIQITQEQLRNRLDNSDPALEVFIQLVLQRYRGLLHSARHIEFIPTRIDEGSNNKIWDTSARHKEALENLILENDLRVAIEEKQFVLFYQPIIDMDTLLPSGFEALIRWQHPEHGLIFPDRFLDIAEKSGLIVPIGEWVAYEASRALSRLQKGFSHVLDNNIQLSMNVNASGEQLVHERFVAQITALIASTGIQPENLKIEITESALVQQPEKAKVVLDGLKGLGVKTALDDFGTGYSSLNYLRQFPIDYLKIDREFVWSMLDNRIDQEIVVSVTELAHKLGMKVVAEGIESAEHLVMLKNMAVDYGQGYYFSKPQSEEDICRFLQADQASAIAC